MKQTINQSQFRDAFHHAGRGDQFSYEALGLLFDYFEEVDENMELDVIAICCEFSENDFRQIALDYNIDVMGQDDDEALQTVRDYLNNNTIVVGVVSGDTIVYAQF